MTSDSAQRPTHASAADEHSPRLRAFVGLVCTCALWGLSFPVMKVVGLQASLLLGGISTWSVSAATLVLRFGSSALLLCLFGFARPSAREWQQGLWLALFTGAGMLLQMDALNFTSASTAAFLTQGYIVILPLAAALSTGRLPRPKIVICVLAVAAGLALLSGFDGQRLHMGRGEAETLLAALCFAFQILSLDHPAFGANRSRVVSILMFAGIALLLVPVALCSAHATRDLRVLFSNPVVGLFGFVLSVPCTAIAFSLMNRYQRDVGASEAGIIYGAEPLFASLYALFVPRILAALAGVDYENERLTQRLLVGGGLVITANVLLQLPFGGARVARPSPPERLR